MGSTQYERATRDIRAEMARGEIIDKIRAMGREAAQAGLDERLMIEIFRQGYAKP